MVPKDFQYEREQKEKIEFMPLQTELIYYFILYKYDKAIGNFTN